ncbi:MAG: hypothetical protein K2X38_23105 [Gemmataceae bacterium]|nr:hypothetical protein [Gemmataceae bacterium]
MTTNRNHEKGATHTTNAAIDKDTGVEREAPLFPPGRMCVTDEAFATLVAEDVMKSLLRHLTGDWGDCGKEDWKENDFSLKESLRLFSVYHDRKGTKFWIITEADRSATTVLLPSEY